MITIGYVSDLIPTAVAGVVVVVVAAAVNPRATFTKPSVQLLSLILSVKCRPHLFPKISAMSHFVRVLLSIYYKLWFKVSR